MIIFLFKLHKSTELSCRTLLPRTALHNAACGICTVETPCHSKNENGKFFTNQEKRSVSLLNVSAGLVYMVLMHVGSSLNLKLPETGNQSGRVVPSTDGTGKHCCLIVFEVGWKMEELLLSSVKLEVYLPADNVRLASNQIGSLRKAYIPHPAAHPLPRRSRRRRQYVKILTVVTAPLSLHHVLDLFYTWILDLPHLPNPSRTSIFSIRCLPDGVLLDPLIPGGRRHLRQPDPCHRPGEAEKDCLPRGGHPCVSCRGDTRGRDLQGQAAEGVLALLQ